MPLKRRNPLPSASPILSRATQLPKYPKNNRHSERFSPRTPHHGNPLTVRATRNYRARPWLEKQGIRAQHTPQRRPNPTTTPSGAESKTGKPTHATGRHASHHMRHKLQFNDATAIPSHPFPRTCMTKHDSEAIATRSVKAHGKAY